MIIFLNIKKKLVTEILGFYLIKKVTLIYREIFSKEILVTKTKNENSILTITTHCSAYKANPSPGEKIWNQITRLLTCVLNWFDEVRLLSTFKQKLLIIFVKLWLKVRYDRYWPTKLVLAQRLAAKMMSGHRKDHVTLQFSVFILLLRTWHQMTSEDIIVSGGEKVREKNNGG